ncbi:uncharacterized protein BYT42DRAFT_547448 [Radiomyces spectabilis]|uniref:uncharacterized protein n=1 Tax=Radiomyces spectabilis TaxID=64574 RepID=UPI00221F60A6|nr:uncharacterized protein BYT42DRAFT_547448 [Radiomyces spectabilis]KAI8374402.1 hypothetical protein BYT42DRAFT_547448 [Radiomyces spectabilis]
MNDITAYAEKAQDYLLNGTLTVQNHVIPMRYVTGALGGLLGLYGVKRYFNGGWDYDKCDLEGKVAIVTGANAGIGKATAMDLAKRHATVIIACRDSKKSHQALAEIQKVSKNTQVFLEPLDLSDLASVRAFVDRFLARGLPLHILINNAAVLVPERKSTKDGFEMQFGTNHLGHFLLTELLLPTLEKSAPSRVVNVSSGAFLHGTMNFDDLHAETKYGAWTAYSQSKFANVLYANYLDRKHRSKGIIANSCHPGAVRTTLGRYLAEKAWWCLPILALLYPLYYLTFKNAEQGAQTTLYLAANRSVTTGGEYWADCKMIKNAHKEEYNTEMQDQLYEISRNAVQEFL